MRVGQDNFWTKNNRPKMLAGVFREAARHMKPDGVITTDGSTAYPRLIAQHMPGVKHLKHVVNTGSTHDPLFAINHVFATMRQDMSRLFRSTWSHSKDITALRAHLWLYVAWRNGYDLGRDVRDE
jgi:spermidine synthase